MKKWISLVLSIILAFNMVGFSYGFAESSALGTDPHPEFRSLGDPALRTYIEDTLYESLVSELDSEDYFVENVTAIYISQDYLDELEYNSKANVFFGYTLNELEAQFEGNKYVFTLGENNETVVEPWKDYVDPMGQVIKNVAIGTGVILVCVTVSVVTAGTGTYACSMIFAMAAQGGAIGALYGGRFGALSAGVVKLVQTGNVNEAFDAALIGGSEGFKWGAITGVISGGAGEAIALKGATLNGLQMNEAAWIQRESGYPLSLIKEFHSVREFEIYQESGLFPYVVDGKAAMIREINIHQRDAAGRTNLERMLSREAPLDPDGIAYELHHVGQKSDSVLAILTRSEHRGEGNFRDLHDNLISSVVDHGSSWETQKRNFWKSFGNMLLEFVL